MFRFLNKNYSRVNSGGKTFNNIGGPINDKIKIFSNHNFNIAFENSSYPGYVTEKITDAFIANTIPIYWGDKKS